MDKKIYESTRYQNIYRHKKNKNYVIMISTPVKTSISRIDGKKIMEIKDALSIRDNPKIKRQKAAEIKCSDNFDEIWYKYINYCKYQEKMAYNTCNKKLKIYNKHLKDKFQKQIGKIKKEDIWQVLNQLETTDKQKNEILKQLKAFFSWCSNENYILLDPTEKIKKYKVPKPEMKYWLPEHLKQILYILNQEIDKEINIDDTDALKRKYNAYIVKMIIIIGFSLGDRIGETRALQFGKVSKEFNTIRISNSINYNTKDDNFLSSTKTIESDDVMFVSSKVIKEIFKFKDFLNYEMKYKVTKDTPILINIATNKPYSDSRLREMFNYYIDLANIPKIRMYDLRHTLATTLMSAGYDMYDIQDRLRHKSIKTTIDNYGHITVNKKKQVAEFTAQYF